MNVKIVESRLKSLSPDLYREAVDFIDFLVQRQKNSARKGGFSLTWAGALKKYKKQYSSVELQKKSLEWR